MPQPGVSKIHFTFDPESSTLRDALDEARAALADVDHVEVTTVEFDDESVIDVDALPIFDDPLDMRIWRSRYGEWGWAFYNRNGHLTADVTTARACLDELVSYIANNDGPRLAIVEQLVVF